MVVRFDKVIIGVYTNLKCSVNGYLNMDFWFLIEFKLITRC